MNHSITPLITESERVLAEAITHFDLNVKPSQLTVTIQTRGRSRAAGWFAWDRWAASSGKVLHMVDQVGSDVSVVNYNINDAPRHEINLSAECLHDCDMGMVLIHELAHAENHILGDQDCDKTHKKHNLVFKAMAERLGLDCQEKDGKVGWGNTTLGSEGKKFLESIKFDRSLFELFRLPPEKKDKATTRMLKLACPNEACGYIVRTTRGNITKGLPTCPCGETFVEEIKENEEEE